MSDFVSLHTHTTYSIMDSLIKPTELFKRVKDLGQSAVAVTDHGTLSGAWDCLKYSKEAGVKLIMGCEFYFVDDVANPTDRTRHIILLAKNHQGYKNLLRLNKLANDNFIVAFKKVIPRIDWKLLEANSEGLICTTACSSGILGQLISNKKSDEAKLQAKRLKDIFGDNLALEIQPNALRRQANAYHDYRDQVLVNNQLIKWGDELDIKIVPAIDAHYLTPDQHEAHDVLLAIGAGQPVRSRSRLSYDNEFYLKSRQEVRDFFARLYKDKADVWCDNTLYFSSLCEDPEWIDPKFSNPSGKELPEFPVQDQKDFAEFKIWLEHQPDALKAMPSDAAYLRYWCETEFVKRVPVDKVDIYRKRLDEEYEVIEFHGFSSYMLIVADYIDYCKRTDIPVGPGRGSVGGSLIGWLMGIHQADPIKYNLIFARFHNKEKTSFPDIDSDFAPSGRERVQEYIRRKYGEDRVAHVSNVNTMTPKVYARDIARTFEFGGDRKAAVAIGTAIADSIPEEIKTIEEALEKAPLFSEFADGKYGQLRKFAEPLGAKAKAWSTHAGGLVIGKRPLAEFIPLRRDKEGSIAIEYEKERAESNGLVKMDTLGLETLDIIDKTYELIALSGKPLPPKHLNYDEYDAKTYDLLSRGDTLCVFQLGESGGTIDLCRKVKPKSIEDISLINALARPSARDIREDFVAARNGTKPVELLHPSLQRAFGPTYGFGLFEECLMYLAQDVAGWDLHDSDRLRKLTKEKGKNPKKVAAWKKEFIDDAVMKKGIDAHIATKIWEEVVDKFQGYGFNVSHSTLYSMISYHTAYLKAHYPLEFLTANLISEVKSNAKKSADNILRIKDEVRSLNVKILPPNINQSEMTYKIINDNTLLTGLDSLKFVGKNAIPEILAKRSFSNFEDFLSKIDGRKITSKGVQALTASGCLDSFGMTRKEMFLHASDYKKKIQVWLKKHRDSGKPFNYPWPTDTGEWSTSEKYAMEIVYIGEGLSGNIREAYPNFFDNRACDFSKLPDIYPCFDEDGERIIYDKVLISGKAGIIEGVVKSCFEFKV
ncbi:MAG TPA: DNA polymerase III subunit alpha, partial [Anaerovoracaceae bacterium]|nr:DNA polymerase III subunit alpha [Anaerovoracaceae bacterium]